MAHYLVQENQFDDLSDLLSYNRELVLTKDTNGWTPLHEAARNGNPLMIYFLIANGVDPLGLTDQGHTALGILRASRPKASADNDNDAVKGLDLSQTILEKAEKGKDLNNQIIDEDAIKESKGVQVNMPS